MNFTNIKSIIDELYAEFLNQNTSEVNDLITKLKTDSDLYTQWLDRVSLQLIGNRKSSEAKLKMLQKTTRLTLTKRSSIIPLKMLKVITQILDSQDPQVLWFIIAKAFASKSETRSREPSENGSIRHSNRWNYTGQLSILQAYIAFNQVNVEEKLSEALKGRDLVNTVIFTRFK